MSEKKRKEITPEQPEIEPLDDDELEKIGGGTGPDVPPYGFAPDGNMLPIS